MNKRDETLRMLEQMREQLQRDLERLTARHGSSLGRHSNDPYAAELEYHLTRLGSALNNIRVGHHSLELYLKAILMNYDKYSKTDTKIHNLTELLNMVDGLNPKIDEKLKKVVDNRSIKQWISFINPFGYPNGGIRYMQKGKSMYATPLGISYFFNELIDVINSECNQEKEIDELV